MPISDTVRVESGLISGTAGRSSGVRVFKGVPYARPPVGPLRWRAPQPVERWDGVRPATQFAPRCVQPDRPRTAIGYFGPERESEDCLYLNIWTAARAADERQPIMVWFHGGAFAVGSGALPIFDGENLARKGVVVVTVNYRLGRLGFLAHPGLSREASYGASGNYGLLDQLAAVRWIGRNGAAFGGDPERITIFGQSVGASSVHCLMSSPLAAGTFHRAIGQSGGAFDRTMLSLDAAERAGAAFAQSLGASSIDDLRDQPARTVQLFRPDTGALAEIYDSGDERAVTRDTAWAIIDGHFLREPVFDTFARGAQNDVPLITGSNADEGSTLPGASGLQALRTRAEAEHATAAAAFFALYPATDDASADAAARRATGDRTFTWQNWLWASMQARTGRAKAYYYFFSRSPPRPIRPGGGDLSRPLGAFHTAEIPYVFHHLQAREWPWEDADRRLADVLSSYWANFAASGNPNSAGLPPWPSAEPDARRVLAIGDAIGVTGHPLAARIAFWQANDERLRTAERP